MTARSTFAVKTGPGARRNAEFEYAIVNKRFYVDDIANGTITLGQAA